MLLDDHDALKDAKYVLDVADAVLRARAYDPVRASICLCVVAQVIAMEDPKAKTLLAITMFKMARELDKDVVDLKWEH